jgi:hypothetical protein
MQLPNESNKRIQGSLPSGADSELSSSQLPFVVRVVRTEDHLRRVCEVRSQAYGRHVPEFGASLREPELFDREPGSVVFMVDDKATGQTIGTLRVHTNAHRPLPVQGVVTVPEGLSSKLLVEVCRLSVRPGFNKTEVTLALFKALYLYCLATQVQYMVVAAKKPLNGIYLSLGFEPLAGEQEQWVPLPYAHNIEHSVMKFSVPRAEQAWSEMGHPLHVFMSKTYHPDIQIFSAVSPSWNQPRRVEAGPSEARETAQA